MESYSNKIKREIEFQKQGIAEAKENIKRLIQQSSYSTKGPCELLYRNINLRKQIIEKMKRQIH